MEVVWLLRTKFFYMCVNKENDNNGNLRLKKFSVKNQKKKGKMYILSCQISSVNFYKFGQ